MSSEHQEAWQELLEGVAAVNPFPYSDFVNRLHNKVKGSFAFDSGAGDILRSYIDKAPNYPPDDSNPESTYVDIFEISDLIIRLSISAASDGIAANDSSLKQCVSQDNSKLRYLESLTNLMGFFFLEHINMHLRSQGKRDLNSLYQIDGFQQYCLDQIKSADFIRTEILHDLSAGDHRFSIAYLIIADYMDNRSYVFRNTPSAGDDFADKASYKALVQWSYTLWDNGGKDDPAQMDQIVAFCGKAATIGLCPPNPSTGLQRPTATSTVMNSFYNIQANVPRDGAYATDVQASLARLQDQQEIIDEWKAYCETFASNWESQIRTYWNTGFFRLFQDQQTNMVKLWLSAAKQDEEMQYKWVDYLPVIKDPYDDLNLTSTTIPAGTPITLANGTQRLIESIAAGDSVLTHAASKASVRVAKKPSHEPGKAKLIGFNGETPSIPSSQVFHTSTGLRAVDPTEAHRLNPYQNIGRLAVGHVVFRLVGGEYKAVGIESISQTKESLIDRVYTLSLAGERRTYHAHGYLVDMNAPTQATTEIVDLLRKVPGSKRLGLLSRCQEMWPMFKKFEGQCLHQRLNWELFGKYQSPDGENPKLKGSISFADHVKVVKTVRKPVGVPIERLARGFSLKPRHPGRLPVGYKLPKLSMIDGYLLVDDQVQLRSKYDPHTRCFRWTRELRKPGLLRRGLFEHGTIGIHPDAVSGTGVIYLSADPEALTTPSRDQVHPFEAHARGLDRLHVSESEDQDTWNPFGQYKVTLDQSVWPPDTDRTEPETPVDGGTMEDGTMLSPHGVTTYLVQFPLIDQLREQINTKFNQKLGTFYQVSGKYVDGLQSFTVAFEKAPLVPFVSDAGVDITKKFNVGFNSKLGIDVTLPTLFKQMTFTLDVNYHSFSGYFFEYDPSKRGYKGDRHLITGTLVDSSAAEQGRAKISSAYASISNPSMPVGMSEKLEPAPVTHNLLLLKDPSIKDLMTFSGYDERDLHNTSQLLIKNMMYYHMDSDQREKILREPQPVIGQDIPASLADQLPSELKTFFKEKYGPAFICRYVGKTQKYAPKFTEKEIKNLWYWFEGNGKNSLSQSEEYNDINRLSSRSAMLTLYDKNLEPYLTNNPDKWADDLCDQLLGDRHQMMVFINNPIPDGNNVVNKQCNILDALSASADRAKKYFDGFMDFAWQQGAQTADIEGGDQDQEYLWIYDAMNQLVVAILEGSADISDEVRQALMEDINDFEIANGLNQQLDAEQRAAAILEKTSIFTRELAGWMSSIGKGLAAAFGGTALFKWAGQAFDSVAAKYSNLLPGVDKLKGLSSLCMVGVSLATAAVSIWGLVNNWNSMSDAGRATVIIQVVGMAVDAAGKAVDAFKSFKSKPSSTPTDEINTEALNDSLSDVVTNNTEKVGDLAQTIAGDEEYRTAMGEGLHGDGTMAQSNPEESWNEKLTDPAADVPPGYEEAAKKFNLSGNILKVLNVILGIGLVMAMSFSLAHDWSSMNDTGKALGVLNIVVQGLTVLLDIIDLGEAVGLYAVTGTMSVALPILGAVLAVIGIVLMIVQFFISLFVARQEPPDPIQDFVDDVGHALIKNFDEAPDPQLQYSISQTQVQGGDTPVFQIEGVNNSSEDVTLSHVTITLYSGDDDVCLFAETTDVIQLVKESDQNHDSVGYTYVTPSSVAAAQLPYPAKLGNTSNYYEYDLQVAGPPMEAATGLQALVLKQSDKFQSVWTAVINMPGDDAEKSTSWVEVVEVGLNDKTQQQFMLKRV